MVSGVRGVHSSREANALLKHRLRVAAPLLDPDSSLHPVPWSLPLGTASSALRGGLVGHRYALQPAGPLAVPVLWDHGESVSQTPGSFTTGNSKGPPAIHRVVACLVEDAESAVRRRRRHFRLLEPGRDCLRPLARLGSADRLGTRLICSSRHRGSRDMDCSTSLRGPIITDRGHAKGKGE